MYILYTFYEASLILTIKVQVMIKSAERLYHATERLEKKCKMKGASLVSDLALVTTDFRMLQQRS